MTFPIPHPYDNHPIHPCLISADPGCGDVG